MNWESTWVDGPLEKRKKVVDDDIDIIDIEWDVGKEIDKIVGKNIELYWDRRMSIFEDEDV